MSDFLKQDIFFFITSVGVVVITILLGTFLFYVIRIARTVDHILAKVREETDIISEELAELRRNIRKEGMRLKHLAKFVNNIRKKS
jgi:hypothetical protein